MPLRRYLTESPRRSQQRALQDQRAMIYRQRLVPCLLSKLLLCLSIGMTMAMSGLSHAQEAVQPERTFGLNAQAAVRGEKFMVASAHPLASAAGKLILQQGGSAADAAVVIQLMLNLVEPQSSGLGGGAFVLYREGATGRLTSFDGRETAPQAATANYWLNSQGEPIAWWDAVMGGRAVGVPGTPMLLQVLHQRYGQLPLAEVVAPVIERAEQGFAITPRMASSIAEAKGLDRLPSTRKTFFTEEGKPKQAGDVFTNLEFAKTLRVFAEQGASPFYTGEFAQNIVDVTSKVTNTENQAGLLTMADFANYRVIERPPVCMDYRDYEVCGMGPPSSGALTVGQILGILQSFDIAELGNSAAAWHLFAEASKLAYADRALYMADADFVAVPVNGLLNPGYLRSRAALIDTDKAMGVAAAGTPPSEDALSWSAQQQLERPGTSHFTVVDSAGNMVSMTTTIETGFGSRLMANGYLLNNEMTDFSFLPTRDGKPVANAVAPNKRPRSSMAPTVVLHNEQPFLLLGSPGGSRIIEYVAQALVAILDWGYHPQAAFNLGHVINRNDTVTELEQGSDISKLAEALEAKGHEIKVRNLNSGLHGILINDDGRMIGGADRRREGLVLAE